MWFSLETDISALRKLPFLLTSCWFLKTSQTTMSEKKMQLRRSIVTLNTEAFKPRTLCRTRSRVCSVSSYLWPRDTEKDTKYLTVWMYGRIPKRENTEQMQRDCQKRVLQLQRSQRCVILRDVINVGISTKLLEKQVTLWLTVCCRYRYVQLKEPEYGQ